MNHGPHPHPHPHGKRKTSGLPRARGSRPWSVAPISDAERADELIESLETCDSDVRFVPDWLEEPIRHAA